MLAGMQAAKWSLQDVTFEAAAFGGRVPRVAHPSVIVLGDLMRRPEGLHRRVGPLYSVAFHHQVPPCTCCQDHKLVPCMMLSLRELQLDVFSTTVTRLTVFRNTHLQLQVGRA